jgi:hypothetical protein
MVAVRVGLAVIVGVAVAVPVAVKVGLGDGVRVKAGVLVHRRAIAVSSNVGEAITVGVCGASMSTSQPVRINSVNTNTPKRNGLSLIAPL